MYRHDEAQLNSPTTADTNLTGLEAPANSSIPCGDAQSAASCRLSKDEISPNNGSNIRHESEVPANVQPIAAPSGSPSEKLELIMGREGLLKLQSSRVMVLGLGGVGSSCVEALARGGIGSFVLLDSDIVQPSNINRQAIAFQSTIGQKKAQVMARMVHDINPDAAIETHERFLTAEDTFAFLDAYRGAVDYIIDAIDTVSTKLAIAEYVYGARNPKALLPAEAGLGKGMRLISSMGAANKLHPECIRSADIFRTENCPLCRVMRRECRKRGIAHLPVVYSCEQPVKVPSSPDAPRSERSNLGTASFMPPMMGQFIAACVLRELAGLEGQA